MVEGIEKIDILDIGVSAINMDDALQQIEHWIETEEQNYVCVCANESIMISQKHSELRRSLNQAGMVVPDGISLVWASRLLGHRGVEQVRGTDLMVQVCSMTAQKGYSNFLYGATEDVLDKLANNLKQRFPELKIVGTCAPPFRPLTEQESKHIIDTINAANPDVLWVGLGGTKQDVWMAHYIDHLDVPVIVGIGAAFDFISGNKPECPRWIQKIGLEWFFRFVEEPRRLWRRASYNPIFAYKILMQKLFG